MIADAVLMGDSQIARGLLSRCPMAEEREATTLTSFGLVRSDWPDLVFLVLLTLFRLGKAPVHFLCGKRLHIVAYDKDFSEVSELSAFAQ